MGSLVWLVIAGFGVAFLIFLGCVAHWIAHAEVGSDRFDDLQAFDDDEAAALLQAGTR